MTDFNDFVLEQLKDEEFQKEYMNDSLAQYVNDGDFNAFFRSLEMVIKSRDSISGFCEKPELIEQCCMIFLQANVSLVLIH